jgi:hypothetical protein
MSSENALNSRRAFRVDNGRWVIEESWNLDHPDCPMVLIYGLPLGQKRDDYRVQKVMTNEEYRDWFGERGLEG